MIAIVGVNHRTAPVAMREQLSFTEDDALDFLTLLSTDHPGMEAVLLSTCNRTELYLRRDRRFGQPDMDRFREILCSAKSCDSKSLAGCFYSHIEKTAVEHLLRVASGLDSMVLGENQVLGQIKAAYRVSSDGGFTSTILNRLFHLGFSVGKRVRTETGINEGASSVGYAAVELASKIFTRIQDHPVTLIGAGEMGALVLQCLMKRGCSHIHVANRTRERALAVARRFGAEVTDYDDLVPILTHSDIVVASTGSSSPVVERDLLTPVMKKRRNRPLFLIDLGVPRNIAVDVKKLDEVYLYNIDDLEQVVAYNRKQRGAEVARAEDIIVEETARFLEWRKGLSLSPAIRRLKESLDDIGVRELEKLSNSVTAEELERMEEYADFLKDKFLGLVVKRLKELTFNGRHLEYVDLVKRLFDFDSEHRS